WLTPIYMKKGRPGVMLSVLVPLGMEESALDMIFNETSTLGVRISKQSRRIAQREIITVNTPLGNIRVKIGSYKGRVVSTAPEYEDCSKIATVKGLPLKQVFELAKKSADKILTER
ncbi:MAG: DUF111 family protein, partial [Rubrobacteridae bacterium]|nr:DUF111 family protein [Rubrobacteridae bacterium]